MYSSFGFTTLQVVLVDIPRSGKTSKYDTMQAIKADDMH
jgi:hypothetical protein